MIENACVQFESIVLIVSSDLIMSSSQIMLCSRIMKIARIYCAIAQKKCFHSLITNLKEIKILKFDWKTDFKRLSIFHWKKKCFLLDIVSNFNIFYFLIRFVISKSMQFFLTIAHWILTIFIFGCRDTSKQALNMIRTLDMIQELDMIQALDMIWALDTIWMQAFPINYMKW